MSYNSKLDTLKHIGLVQRYGTKFINYLNNRLIKHDASKLEKEERQVFDKMTPRLKACTYGSEKYKRFLEEMKPALKHHYANNRHHPEFFGEECIVCQTPKDPLKDVCQMCGNEQYRKCQDPIANMNLIDIVEMLSDWKGATLRHADGDILKSIKINQERFGYSDELKSILINTIKELGWED